MIVKGSWTVDVTDTRINSDDFTHDASLILYGDFAPMDKRPYLEFIAKELNDAPVLRTRLSALERVVEAAKNVEESLVWYEKGDGASLEHERAEQIMDARRNLRTALRDLSSP